MRKIICVLGLLLPVFIASAKDPLRNPFVSGDFNFTNNSCSGTAVQFSVKDTVGTPPFTYSWDFGDGGTGSGPIAQHAFTALGCGTITFQVSVKIKDAANDSITVRKPITIKRSPNVTLQDLANPFSPFSNCGNSPTNAKPEFKIQPGLGTPTDACIDSFSVDWGDGSAVLSRLTAASFPLSSHTYMTLGLFNLVVTAWAGGCSTTKTYPVANQANPAVGISGPPGTTGCAPIGFWFNLRGYELNSPGTTYTWDFGDKSPTITWTPPITPDSIYHVFTTTSCGSSGNQFTAKVTAKNGCDTKDATVNNIKIFVKPVANFNLPAGGSACVSTSLTFTASPSVMAYNAPDCNRSTMYSWSSDDGGTQPNSPSYSHTFTTTGSHTVTLIAFGGCGNDTVTKTINITAPPPSPTPGSNGPLCAGGTLNLTASTVTGATYAWTGPGGYTSTLQNPVRTGATTAMSGTYSVTALLNGCASVPATVGVVVNATPAAPAGTTTYNYCLNAAAPPLTATGATGNTLNWYTTATGGTPSTTAPTPLTTTAGVTTYYVSQVNPATPACESARLAIAVTVRVAAVITGASTDPTSCTTSNGSILLSGLSPNTSYTVQYTRNSGTPASQAFTSNAAGNITVTGLASGTYTNITATFSGCSSNTVGPFTLVSPSAPNAPTAGNSGPLCSGSTFSLTASNVTGASYAWTGPGGYTSTSQNPTRTNATAAMSGPYSVTVTINGCTSAPATTTVVVGQIAAAPVVATPVDYCQRAAAVPLVATALTGNTLNWYTSATGGTASTATPTPSTATAGSVTYYVSQVTAAPPACESPRSPITVNVKPAPVISGNPTNPTGCASSNGAIVLSGLTAGTAYAVQYTLNGGTPAPATLTANASGVITIANLSAGTYTNITATLNGCSSNSVGPFTLTSFSAPAPPTAGSNSPLCAGSSLNLTAGTASAGATYSWTGPNGYTSTQQNPVRTNTNSDMSGTYSVTVSLNGCTSTPASVNVLVNPSGTVTAGSNSPLCAGGTLTLLSGIGSTGTFSWSWSGPNNFSSSQQNPSIQNVTAAASGTYTVTASSPAGSCSSSATISVLVTAQPVITAASANSPGTCSAGTGSITLQGLVPNMVYAVQYARNNTPQAPVALAAGSGGILLIPNLADGVYSAITVSQGGCVSNAVGPFTLTNTNTLPGAPKATTNSPLCVGGTLQLGASTTATGTLAYQWSGPNGFTSAAQNPAISNITLAAAGKYYVSVSAGSCISAKDSVDVQIGTYPVVNLGPDLVLAAGSQQALTPSIQNGPVTQYLWSPATNLSCNTCASPVVTAQATISYILKVTNSYGCSASDTIGIKTLCEGSNVFIPDAFTPDGDGLNDRFVIRASGPIRVKYFRVFNKWGELVFEKMNFLPNDPAYGWDGKVKGVAVPPDVFVYTALVTCEGGASFPYKGNVTVLK
ncbi:MAG: PKD domain-containing protein [Williamsia sp.]|nr:PKD domain-containing protein [Williamsia sp.]